MKSEDKQARQVVAAIPYYPEKDRFLLVKRSSVRKRFPNEWEFPSGFLEDETEQQGALRELKEETGLIGEVIKTGESFEVETEKHHFRIHPVLVRIDSDDVELTEEHEELEWIEPGEVGSFNTVPQLRKNLKRVGVL